MSGDSLFNKKLNTVGEGIFNKVYSMADKRQEYPLDYNQTDYYNHREKNNNKEDYIRIGDCELTIPPEYIQVETTGQMEQQPILRQKTSMKEKRSKKIDEIKIQFPLSGVEQINGYKVKAPGGNKYYMDGLRSLVAQFSKAPFLPVVNYLLNIQHGVYNVALGQLTVTSLDEYADSFYVVLKLYKMNITPYTNLPNMSLDSMFNWELFRWYYQRSLFKSDDNSRYFKPMDFDLQSIFNIGLLKQEYLSKLDETIDYEDIVKEENYSSIVNNNEQSFVVENMTCSFQNILTKHEISGQSDPTYQFMGTTNMALVFKISTKDTRVVASFKEIMNRTSETLLEKNNIEGLGFARIQNELIRMMGVEFLILSKVTVETQKGFPGLYNIQVHAYDFGENQKHREAITGFKPFNNNRDGTDDDLYSQDRKGMINKITQDNYVEKKIESMEMYPDLDLPTFQQVDQQIANINSFRNTNGFEPMNIEKYPKEKTDGKFVDPDFYLFYPKMSNETKGNKDHENISTKKFDIDVDKLGDPVEIKTPIFDTNEYGYATISEDMSGNINTMFCGMKEEKRGRLVNAFPSYLFLILDQANHWLDGQKLWTNYYTNQSLMSIDITHERTQPVGTAYLRISNIYKSLEDEADFSKLKKNPQEDNYFYKEFGWHVNLKVNEEVIYNKNILKKRFKLNSGAKIHVRLGYGSNGANYPINFNGYITSIQHDEAINIVAQSDARELVTQPFSGDEKTTNSLFKLGNEPSNIIKNLLQNRQTFIAHIFPFWSEGSKYGIESFGMINKHEYLSHIFNNNKEYYNKLFENEIKAGGLKDAYDLSDEKVRQMIIDKSPDLFDGYNYTEEKLTSSAQEIEKNKMNMNAVNNLSLASLGASKEWNATYGMSIDETKIYFEKQGEYTKQKYVNSYDLTKNIYASRPDKAIPYPSIDLETFANFDNEGNIKIYLDNMTTWDILKNLEYVRPSFIATPMYHQFESRLFYGKKHWLARYAYKAKEGEIVDMAKSFQQFYYVNDKNNIINNTIKTNSKNLVTSAITKWHHTDNGEEKGDIIHADATIHFNKQKTNIFESDITGDLFGPDKLYNGLGWGIHERNANLFSVSQLKESFNRMYDGELVIRGIGGIKPHDLIYIDDDFKRMYGNIEARRVTHSFEPKMGFITTIKPDLIASSSDGLDDTLHISRYLNNIGRFIKLSFTLREFLRSNIVKTTSALYLGKFHLGTGKVKAINVLKNAALRRTKELYKKINEIDNLGDFFRATQKYFSKMTLFKNIGEQGMKNGIKTGLSNIKDTVTLANERKKALSLANNVIEFRDELMKLKGVDTLPSYYMEMDLLDDITPEMLKLIDNIDDVDEIGQGTIILSKLIVQFKKGGITTKSMKQAFNILKNGMKFTPAIVYWVVLDIIMDLTINAVIDWFDHRHSIVIDPLIKDGEPFVVGVDGAQKLIPGYKFSSDTNGFISDDGLSTSPNQQYVEEYGAKTVANMNQHKTTSEGAARNFSNTGRPGEIDLNSVTSTKNGARIARSGFIWPLDYIKQDFNIAVTSKFGWRVINGKDDEHKGIDLDGKKDAVDGGYNIVAAESGVVTSSLHGEGYGNYISIKHGNNFKTLYAHLKERFVDENEEVKKGQVIGIMGETGRSFGVHLHFEIRINNNKKDPLKYLPKDLLFGYKLFK